MFTTTLYWFLAIQDWIAANVVAETGEIHVFENFTKCQYLQRASSSVGITNIGLNEH